MLLFYLLISITVGVECYTLPRLPIDLNSNTQWIIQYTLHTQYEHFPLNLIPFSLDQENWKSMCR